MENINISKIKVRKEELKLTFSAIARLSKTSERTTKRFFNGENIQLHTATKIMKLLGINLEGKSLRSVSTIRKIRANKKATYIASLTQDTSKMEAQEVQKSVFDKTVQRIEKLFLKGSYQKELWDI
ncbi:MAG: hypothetical protein JKY89_05360 [Immundisolibacteraceae bacterium]|nr:hypothetical protein [Immundisolibacteraceae bacterium]